MTVPGHSYLRTVNAVAAKDPDKSQPPHTREKRTCEKESTSYRAFLAKKAVIASTLLHHTITKNKHIPGVNEYLGMVAVNASILQRLLLMLRKIHRHRLPSADAPPLRGWDFYQSLGETYEHCRQKVEVTEGLREAGTDVG